MQLIRFSCWVFRDVLYAIEIIRKKAVLLIKFCVVRWENQNSSQSFTLSFFSNFDIYKGFYNQWVCSENVFKVYQICWFNFFLLLKRTKSVKLEKVMEWHSTGICLNGWFEISKMYCFVPDRLAGEVQSGTVYCLYVKKVFVTIVGESCFPIPIAPQNTLQYKYSQFLCFLVLLFLADLAHCGCRGLLKLTDINPSPWEL